MSGKRQLLLDSEDADSLPLLCFNLWFACQDESRFRKIHLTGQRLHLLIGQTARVGENRKRITGKRSSRKNVELHEFVIARHLWAFCLLRETSTIPLCLQSDRKSTRLN